MNGSRQQLRLSSFILPLCVERVRTRAYDNKKLSSGAQQTVTVRQESGRQMILIEPATPETVYVPYYDPGVVYGSWPYPETPPIERIRPRREVSKGDCGMAINPRKRIRCCRRARG